MGSSRPHTRHKHTKRRDDSSTTVPKRKTHHPFLLHILKETQLHNPTKAGNRPDLENNGSNFLILLLTSYIFPFLFSFLSSDVLPQGAEHAHTMRQERNRSAVETRMSFLVSKYFTSQNSLVWFSFSSLCGVASLLVYGKRQGDGWDISNQYPSAAWF